MNQLYRALHMPPGRLFKKLTGWKEIYTIAVRPRPTAEGCEPLPALGEGAYTMLPAAPGHWYADPLLFHKNGQRWIFCEDFDLAANKGAIAAFTLDDAGHAGPIETVLAEDFHLSFPTVFDWNGETWMIPETGADRSLRLYRCDWFPEEWKLAKAFPVGKELADTILLDQTPEALTLLCSEVRPENGLYTRYRRYTLRADASAEGGFTIEEDEPFNLAHRGYDLGARNAGPLFSWGGGRLRPAQVSTKVDYGVYLQFFTTHPDPDHPEAMRETPLCAAMPQNVTITGLDPARMIGIHTYCRDEVFEIIDARYLAQLPPPATR